MLVAHYFVRCIKSPALLAARQSATRRTMAATSCWRDATASLISRRSAATSTAVRSFASALPPDDPQATFRAVPPKSLNIQMARGIQSANQLILRYGVGQQRLKLLSQTPNLPLVQKWQRMMEIYLGAQLHTIAALGYDTNEQGIMMYTQQLAQFIGGCDPAAQEEFRTLGRETWRNMLATAFQLDEDAVLPNGEEMGIVDARNTVHKVASKLMEPSVLETVAQKCAKIPAQSDPQMEMGLKHQIIQDVVVNQVYLGGSPSLVEECGFGSGNEGYAKMQYVMAYHENDPLCTQYTSSAMVKIWQAAGLDLSQSPQAAKMPMASTPGVV